MIEAKNNEGKLIHILDAVSGETYVCLYCGQMLRPRQGSSRPWHYYHVNYRECTYERNIGCTARIKSGEPQLCNDETWRICHAEFPNMNRKAKGCPGS